MNIKNRIQYNSEYIRTRWVGFFDLLGIKRIVESKEVISVFVSYSRAIEKIQDRETAFDNVKYAWFSDSFLIYTADNSRQSFDAINNICYWFSYFLITEEIPIRGAISCSEFYADKENDLFFGKALIEAYEYGEAQDWIGFILCPSAEKQLKIISIQPKKLFEYAYTNIPYKKSKRTSKLTSYLPACILGQWGSPNQCIPILIRMRDRVTDEKIIQKYINTIEFIELNKKSLDFILDGEV